MAAALLAVSGCASPEAARPRSAPEVIKADAFGAVPDDEAGEIAGRVLDDELRPLAQVTVLIVGPGVKSETTDDGVFYFSKVPPRAYTLSFSKPGYGVKNQSLVVPTAQRIVVEVILLPVADDAPYIDDGFVFRGHIDCSVRANASGTNTNPECGQTNGETDVRRGRAVELLPGVTWLLVEVTWNPSLPTVNDKLRLAIRPYQGPSWRQVEGARPIRALLGPAEFASIHEFSEKDYPRYGGQLQLMIFPGDWYNTGSASAGATIQQDFTIYATAFYRMPPPEAYSRLPPS